MSDANINPQIPFFVRGNKRCKRCNAMVVSTPYALLLIDFFEPQATGEDRWLNIPARVDLTLCVSCAYQLRETVLKEVTNEQAETPAANPKS